MRTVSIDINVDVDIDDFLSSMGDYDRKYLMETLKEEGYIPENINISNDGSISQENNTISDTIFNNSLLSLMDKGWRLTKEDEETIIKIANKYDV